MSNRGSLPKHRNIPFHKHYIIHFLACSSSVTSLLLKHIEIVSTLQNHGEGVVDDLT